MKIYTYLLITIAFLSGPNSGFPQSKPSKNSASKSYQRINEFTGQKAPNILIIYSDQHNAQTMGFMGHPDVKTPNFDKLAKSGVAFTRAYCPDAICAPSRNSLMSGLYPRTLGILNNGENTSVLNEVISMASVFKMNGYKTYTFGKRHTVKNIDEGWDVKKSHLAFESPENNYVKWIGEQGYAKEFAQDWATEFGIGPKGGEFQNVKISSAPMGTRISALPDDKTMEAYTAQETIKMIKEQANSDKPFFSWATFYRPHQPYNPQQRFLNMYDTTAWGDGTKYGSSIKMPVSLREPADHLPPFLANQRKSKTGIWCLGKAAEDEQLYRDYIGAYYALVSDVDYQVGQILNALKDNGLEENTIIIYTSDHGDFVGGHGMIEKAALGHNVYEETLQVPYIISWKNHIKGGVLNERDLVSTVDIFPTLLSLTQIKMPETRWPLQGISLAPTLLQNKSVNRDYLVSENWSQASVITQNYKLGIMLDPTSVAKNRDYRSFGNMLFDRAKDPFELKNEIKNVEYSKINKKLTKYFYDFQSKISDEGKSEIIKANEN